MTDDGYVEIEISDENWALASRIGLREGLSAETVIRRALAEMTEGTE